MSLPATIEIPSRLYGSYRVSGRVGQGGMAEIFLGEGFDAQGNLVLVAVKLLKRGAPEERFLDEADLMGMLSHPNLVRFIEHGVAYGRHFIAMEYLLGGDLERVLSALRKARRGVPLGVALHVTIEVLRALAYFHQATTRSGTPLSLVHSDVNPSNVFFSGRGEVKLGDFGVASSSVMDIGQGVTAGKLSYLSPEQTRGEPASGQSDLWAVGVMLHELVAGHHPFRSDGADEAAVRAAIRAARVRLPDSVDKPLAATLTRALNPDLKHRFKTAGEFAGALFGYALDHHLVPTPGEVKAWLDGALELLREGGSGERGR